VTRRGFAHPVDRYPLEVAIAQALEFGTYFAPGKDGGSA
jgi:hypothetical protein